jgi:hypothetical protein
VCRRTLHFPHPGTDSDAVAVDVAQGVGVRVGDASPMPSTPSACVSAMPACASPMPSTTPTATAHDADALLVHDRADGERVNDAIAGTSNADQKPVGECPIWKLP